MSRKLAKSVTSRKVVGNSVEAKEVAELHIDNAWTESVIGAIKNEVLQGSIFRNFRDTQTQLFEYI